MNTVPPQNRPDPFGRLMAEDNSQDKLRNLVDIFSISSPVGPDSTNNAEDVARVEIMMDQLGELDLSHTDGPTGYYGERLKQAISAFQKKVGLPETGRIAPSDTTMTAARQALSHDVSVPVRSAGELTRGVNDRSAASTTTGAAGLPNPLSMT